MGDGGDGAISRREALGVLGAVALGAQFTPIPHLASRLETAGRLKHSVSRWCYGRIPLDQLCDAAKGIGYKSVELLDEKDWAVVKSHGLDCAMANGFGS